MNNNNALHTNTADSIQYIYSQSLLGAKLSIAYLIRIIFRKRKKKRKKKKKERI